MNECNIVRDLMPMYADAMASTDSAAYIEKHIATCADCRDVWRRYQEELPMMQEMETRKNAKKIKRAVWKGRVKILVMLLCAVLLTAALAAGLWWYNAWEDGAFSVVKTFETPDGERCIKLADLSTAGLFGKEGNQLRFYFKDGINRYRTDWQDVDVYWAPDSRTSFFVIENAKGEEELRIVDQKEGHGGGTWNIPGLIPAEEEPDLTHALTELCAAHSEFPTGWEHILFTFSAWGSDSETVILDYVTDTGETGSLDYHYPTETITNLSS